MDSNKDSNLLDIHESVCLLIYECIYPYIQIYRQTCISDYVCTLITYM